MEKILLKLLMLLPVLAFGAWIFFLLARKKLFREYAQNHPVDGKAFLISRVVAWVLTGIAAAAWVVVFVFFPGILRG